MIVRPIATPKIAPVPPAPSLPSPPSPFRSGLAARLLTAVVLSGGVWLAIAWALAA